ncbi:MAG: hypothetical protein AAB697_01875, partial [Patescibacteria group bacterium]
APLPKVAPDGLYYIKHYLEWIIRWGHTRYINLPLCHSRKSGNPGLDPRVPPEAGKQSRG